MLSDTSIRILEAHRERQQLGARDQVDLEVSEGARAPPRSQLLRADQHLHTPHTESERTPLMPHIRKWGR